jgi:hypothetical protein
MPRGLLRRGGLCRRAEDARVQKDDRDESLEFHIRLWKVFSGELKTEAYD